LKTALDLIYAERKRQVDVEGWTPEHDDGHDGGELYRAAICYRDHDTAIGEAVGNVGGNHPPPEGWPWADEWWKPRDRKANLVRAGALILAERDRLGRALGFRSGRHLQPVLDAIAEDLDRVRR
jgi:hypothetical protein